MRQHRSSFRNSTNILLVVGVLAACLTLRAAAGTFFVMGAPAGSGNTIPTVLYKVGPDGTRSVLSNFLDAAQGPPFFADVIPQAMTIGPDATIYVEVHGGSGLEGAIVTVDPATGLRTQITDFANPAQGVTGFRIDTGNLAAEPSGTLLVPAITFGCQSGNPGCTAPLIRVDPTTGARSILTDFNDPTQGPTAFRGEAVAIGPAGQIYVVGRVNGIIQAVLFTVDPITGQRTVLSRLSDFLQGIPAQTEASYVLAVEASGNVLLASPQLSSIYRVFPDGFRIVVANTLSGASGSLIECGGLALDPSSGTIFCAGIAGVLTTVSRLISVNPVTGSQSTISDFNNPLQGPLAFVGPLGFILDPPGPGGILAVDPQGPTCCFGSVIRVFPDTGNRQVLSDWGNAAQGPIGGQIQNVAASSNGDIFVTDFITEPAGGHLFKVNGSNGRRAIVSNFGNPLEGPTGLPNGVAVALDGSVFVTMFSPPALVKFDHGSRTLVADFSNTVGGPSGLLLLPDGRILVAFTDEGTNRSGGLIRVDPATGQQTLFSDFGNPAQGDLGFGPTSLALESNGKILAGAFRGGTCLQDLCMALYEIDPNTGMRRLMSDSNNPGQGPTGGRAYGLAVHPALGILATACSVITPGGKFIASVCTVEPQSGNRAVFSDFNNPAQGETIGNGPISLAVVPAPVPTARLTASVSPPGSGTISPPTGVYQRGTTVTVSATPNPGFAFSGFSGGLAGSVPSQALNLIADTTVVANFIAVAPRLNASVGVRSDGAAAGTRVVPVSLLNSGAGPAANATITSVTGIAVLTGSGAVSVASGLPASVGTVAPGASGSANLVFNWPASATRVRMTINFQATGGYSGSTVITSFR